MTDLRIKRTWTDPEGRVWYVVKGPLAEAGYPSGVGPSKAFQEALREAIARRPAAPVARARAQTISNTRSEAPNGPEARRGTMADSPRSPDWGRNPALPRVEALLYRTRTRGCTPAGPLGAAALSHAAGPTQG